jgi:hypothetical protein
MAAMDLRAAVAFLSWLVLGACEGPRIASPETYGPTDFPAPSETIADPSDGEAQARPEADPAGETTGEATDPGPEAAEEGVSEPVSEVVSETASEIADEGSVEASPEADPAAETEPIATDGGAGEGTAPEA